MGGGLSSTNQVLIFFEIQKSELYYFLVKPINSIEFKLFGVSRFGFDSFSQRTNKHVFVISATNEVWMFKMTIFLPSIEKSTLKSLKFEKNQVFVIPLSVELE